MSTLPQNDWFYKGTRKKMEFPYLPQTETWFLHLLLHWINTTRRKRPAKLSMTTWIMSSDSFIIMNMKNFSSSIKLHYFFFFFFKWSNTCRVWWNNEPKTICTFLKPTTLSISHIILITQCKAYQRRIYK